MYLQAPGFNPINQPIQFSDGTNVKYQMGQDITDQVNKTVEALRKMPFGIGEKQANEYLNKIQSQGIYQRDGRWFSPDSRVTTYANGQQETDRLGSKLRDSLKERYTSQSDGLVFGNGSPFARPLDTPPFYGYNPSFQGGRYGCEHTRERLATCPAPAGYWMSAPGCW